MYSEVVMLKKANKELTNSKDWIAKIISDNEEYTHTTEKNILGIATKIYGHNTVRDEDDRTQIFVISIKLR